MKNREDKIQSEFEQKLRESEHAATHEGSAVREPDVDRRPDTVREDVDYDRNSAARATARPEDAKTDYIPGLTRKPWRLAASTYIRMYTRRT